MAAPYLGQTTNTDVALKFARLQSFTVPYGARSGVSRIAIVLTDGKSNTPTNTAQEARFLKDAGVLVLSIGIGTSIDQTELQNIASSPLDVFQVNNFNILDTIANQVTNKTCEEGKTFFFFIRLHSFVCVHDEYNRCLKFLSVCMQFVVQGHLSRPVNQLVAKVKQILLLGCENCYSYICSRQLLDEAM